MHDHLSALTAPGAARIHSALVVSAAGGKRDRKGARAARTSGRDSPVRRRILLVEDEFLVALEIERILGDLGYEVVATVADLDGALRAVAEGGFDAAVIDINLGGREAYPVADAVDERGIPFLFSTGYGAADIPSRYRARPRLQKPFDAAALGAMIGSILSRAN